jgi:hypothetical protein
MNETQDTWPFGDGQELCELTILTCLKGHVATKTFTPAGSVAFNAGYRYMYHGRAALGLCGLHRLLTKLSAHPQSFVISGVPREGLDLTVPQRRRYLDVTGDSDVSPADQRWVCVDVDTLINEGAEDERERAFELLCALPRPLRSAGCVVQWSSSAGMDGWKLLKAHLWFVLDRPAYCKSWKAWFTGEMEAGRSCKVDLALYQPVQPHYTAAPIFKGVADPLEGARLLLVPGPAVRVPAAVVGYEAWLEQEAEAERKRVAQAAAEAARLALVPMWGRARMTERYAQGALKAACEAVLSTGVGSRHDTLRDEAWATRRFVESGDLTAHEWREALRAAGIAAMGEQRAREIDSILAGAERGAA